MVAPTPAILRARWPDSFPATVDVRNVALQAAIDEATIRLHATQATTMRTEGDSRALARYHIALTYLAAHIATLDPAFGSGAGADLGNGQVAAGPVSSMKAGDVSVDFAGVGSSLGGVASGGVDADLRSTTFGLLYLGAISRVTSNRLPWDG